MALAASRLAALSLLLAVPGLRASCPAGRGYPDNTSTTCVTCGAGTWSGEGSTECTRCPPGTWSSASGAVDVGTCVECPRGTWSSQEGSPTQDSCQNCSPGRWGAAEGLASDLECTACAPGTWSAEYGATSDEVCTACGAGKWSPEPASASEDHCLDCAPGTWSNRTGASSQETCMPCGAGTWSSAWGATDESTCADCEAGFYQPAVGQANQSVCIRCPPGKYGPLTGAEACVSCPAGSWNDGFAKTECNLCPSGKWMHSPGSMRESDCTTCVGSSDCLPDSSARITIDFRNFPYAELDATQLARAEAALAHDIASACGVANETILDLFGKNASVTISPEGTASAFLTEVTGSSAQELATELYAANFRSELVNSTLAVLGIDSLDHLGVGAISLEPEEFVPLVPTTTTVTMTKTATTATNTWTATTSTSLIPEPLSTTFSSGAASRAAGLACLLLILQGSQ